MITIKIIIIMTRRAYPGERASVVPGEGPLPLSDTSVELTTLSEENRDRYVRCKVCYDHAMEKSIEFLSVSIHAFSIIIL